MTRPVPGLAIEQQPEAVVRRMLAYGEARSEGPRGVLAVVTVLQARGRRWKRTDRHEALRPLQFSCFNDDDPNRAKLLTAFKDDPQTWAMVDAVCTLFEQGCTLDPTLGADHYYVEGQVAPPWGAGHPGWKDHGKIGRHRFGVAA